MNRELAIEWLNRLPTLAFGEELFIPVGSRREQKTVETVFQREKRILAQIDPEQASQTHIYSTFRDQKFWVVLRRMDATQAVGFLKDADGTVKRLTVEQSQRSRRLDLMLQDGLSLREIEEIEGELSEEEKRYLGF